MTYRQNYSDLQIAEAYIQGGSQSKGAAILGVPKSTFKDWLKGLRVDPEVYSRPETWEGWDTIARAHASDKPLMGYAALEAGTKEILEKIFATPIGDVLEHENSRILVIPDLHCPYQHRDTLAFLRAVKLEYEPTRVICLGDELDSHAMSFHTSDPDLDSAGTELGRAREFLSELEILFPKLDLLHSNHGSMLYRRGKEHGIPKHMLKSYNDVLGVSEGWQWHEDLTLELPNGQLVHFHHGRSADPLKVAQSLGMSYVAGHYHTQFNIQYFSTPIALNWAMQSGCLIDDHSLAFAYNKLSVGRPILGCSLIINSQPKLVPMLLDRQGNWLGKDSLC